MTGNGPSHPTTNGARPRPPPPKANPLRPMRPKQRTNPLVQRKAGPKPPHSAQQATATSSKNKIGSREDIAERRRQNGGWTDPPPPGCVDIPIMTTKKALLDGIRSHMLRFAPTKADTAVNPTDQNEFARPVTLHRRDAKQPPPGRAVVKEETQAEVKPVDEEERDRLALLKLEKDAQRAIDQAKMAPVMKDMQQKKVPKKAEKDKISINRAPKTARAKKESELRYEEALPWHLEDADGKNVWVASYVSALSETTVALMIDGDVFRMVPLEKWYRMTSKPPFQAYSIEEAEAMMNKKVVAARWEKRKEQEKVDKMDLAATRQLFYGKGSMIKTESDTFRAASRHEKLDHDDLDVSGDEFQDDDEQPTLERQDDEETKDAQERIKREQRGANNFGDGDEQELEKELKEKLLEEVQQEKYGKVTKKKLRKRDNKFLYQSDDSEENPWKSSSESEDSDEEKEREEAERLQAEKDAKEGKVPANAEDDKGKASGASSKGTNTPNKLKAKSLKRAGSPVSESSGNESVRKKAKVKKTAVGASVAAVAVANSARGSRAGTPVPANAAASKRKTKGGAGSGSDGEATAGEMSDGAGGKKKKIKLVASNRGTPTVSRAGSPNPPQGSASPPPNGLAPVTAQDILDCVPDEGIQITALLHKFRDRVGTGPGMMERQDWLKIVRQALAYGPDKKLRRKPAPAST